MAVHIWIRNGYNNNPPDGGCKGDITVIKDLPHSGFAQKDLLNYTFLEVTDKSRDEIIDYVRAYNTRLNYSVHSSDTSLDEWTIDIFCENVNLEGKGKLDHLDIKHWFDSANMQIVGTADNGARVKFKIKNVVGSNWFWFNKNISAVTMSEDNYDEPTARHDGRIVIPYSVKRAEFITKVLLERGATNQVNDIQGMDLVVTFSITRQQVLDELKKHMLSYFQFQIKNQRWRISEVDIDSLETYHANNGIPYQLTGSQLLATLIDKELE